MNGRQIIYSSNFINDILGGVEGRFSVYYHDSFDVELEPNANYVFTVNFFAIQSPSQTPSPSKCKCFVHLHINVATYVIATYSTCKLKVVYP